MIGLVIGQLLKLKNCRIRQKIPRIHIIFEDSLRRITPPLSVHAVLPGTGTAGRNQTLVTHFLCYGCIPVNARLHFHKHPVRMLIFQFAKGILIRSGELIHIRITDRRPPAFPHHGRRRKRNIGFLPLHKILIRSRQIPPLYVACIFLPVLIKKCPIPDASVFIQICIRNLHSLSAYYCMNGIGLCGRLAFYLIRIAQINQRKNAFIFYNTL